MVNITIYMEGGVLPQLDTYAEKDTEIVDGSEDLIKGLRKLLRQVLSEEDYHLEIKPSGGYKSVSNLFKASLEQNNDHVLLLDLDAPRSSKKKKIIELGLENSEEKVFFMVQEMEAWIVSQPEKIDLYAQKKLLKRKREKEQIKDNSLLKGKHPEDIEKPSVKLNTLFTQYFSIEKERKGKIKPKPKTYAKLKDGPALLELLNIHELRKTFEDVENLIQHIETKKH